MDTNFQNSPLQVFSLELTPIPTPPFTPTVTRTPTSTQSSGCSPVEIYSIVYNEGSSGNFVINISPTNNGVITNCDSVRFYWSYNGMEDSFIPQSDQNPNSCPSVYSIPNSIVNYTGGTICFWVNKVCFSNLVQSSNSDTVCVPENSPTFTPTPTKTKTPTIGFIASTPTITLTPTKTKTPTKTTTKTMTGSMTPTKTKTPTKTPTKTATPTRTLTRTPLPISNLVEIKLGIPNSNGVDTISVKNNYNEMLFVFDGGLEWQKLSVLPGQTSRFSLTGFTSGIIRVDTSYDYLTPTINSQSYFINYRVTAKSDGTSSTPGKSESPLRLGNNVQSNEVTFDRVFSNDSGQAILFNNFCKSNYEYCGTQQSINQPFFSYNLIELFTPKEGVQSGPIVLDAEIDPTYGYPVTFDFYYTTPFPGTPDLTFTLTENNPTLGSLGDLIDYSLYSSAGTPYNLFMVISGPNGGKWGTKVVNKKSSRFSYVYKFYKQVFGMFSLDIIDNPNVGLVNSFGGISDGKSAYTSTFESTSNTGLVVVSSTNALVGRKERPRCNCCHISGYHESPAGSNFQLTCACSSNQPCRCNPYEMVNAGVCSTPNSSYDSNKNPFINNIGFTKSGSSSSVKINSIISNNSWYDIVPDDTQLIGGPGWFRICNCIEWFVLSVGNNTNAYPNCSCSTNQPCNCNRTARINMRESGFVVAGDFDGYNGTPTGNILKLTSGGTLDTSFRTTPVLNGTVNTLLTTIDGSVFAGGDFVVEPCLQMNIINMTYTYPNIFTLYFDGTDNWATDIAAI